MKKIIISLFVLLSLMSFQKTNTETNTEWLLSTSVIKFKIKNVGLNVDGSFTGLKATIHFDGSKLLGNIIDATIDAKTINTGNNTRDGHLKKAEYFDVEKYPTIQMKLSFFSKNKDGSYIGYFNLTIKDKTKSVTMPFTFTEKDGKGQFKGSFTINRLDYGVGKSSFTMADNLTITIEANVIKK